MKPCQPPGPDSQVWVAQGGQCCLLLLLILQILPPLPPRLCLFCIIFVRLCPSPVTLHFLSFFHFLSPLLPLILCSLYNFHYCPYLRFLIFPKYYTTFLTNKSDTWNLLLDLVVADLAFKKTLSSEQLDFLRC